MARCIEHAFAMLIFKKTKRKLRCHIRRLFFFKKQPEQTHNMHIGEVSLIPAKISSAGT
jgi:hypothetical protein